MSKRRGIVDPDYDPEAAQHAGEMMQGYIHQLTDKEPIGKPFVKRQAIGFDLNPDHYRRKRRRK